ncbi:hypothetical protein D9V32_05880 [Mycetocola tolaasinivorans]|uniref:HEPN domain-containing protein n=1 Tax=Mycetocola tolaasinivorans TaxID=76635 RepID=A0A3L7A8A4_9MICO|nr:hypothetical protein [Mycetocola tolaasinivorans]RLP76397.1 hypothetical protein D9V32_05880 [Mycetocola tolaasinivorans]
MNPRGRGSKTVPADDVVRRGRLAKAEQFLHVADDALELALTDTLGVGDAAVTLYVHAGIAAADALCAGALGHHAQGQDHQDAISLLGTVNTAAARELSALLAMKTRAGYGHDPISASNLRRASRAARALVERAAR